MADLISAPASSGLATRHSPLRFCRFASELIERQTLAYDTRNSHAEALAIRHLAIVEAKSLFIKITEQMEWLNAHIGSIDAALQQTPVVLQTVRVWTLPSTH